MQKGFAKLGYYYEYKSSEGDIKNKIENIGSTIKSLEFAKKRTDYIDYEKYAKVEVLLKTPSGENTQVKNIDNNYENIFPIDENYAKNLNYKEKILFINLFKIVEKYLKRPKKLDSKNLSIYDKKEILKELDENIFIPDI